MSSKRRRSSSATALKEKNQPSTVDTKPVKQASSRSTLFALLAVVAAVGGGYSLSNAWKQTELREAYLPQLEEMSRKSPHDGPLMALLGGRLAQTHNPADEKLAAQDLFHAIGAGEQEPIVWRTMAAAHAASGDTRQAILVLEGAKRMMPGDTSDIDATRSRIEALPRAANALDLAGAICPNGADDMLEAYTQGSYLNGIVSWWGKSHPSQSGFATREQWAKDEPNNVDAQTLWGQALLENRRFAEAGTVFENVVKLDPKSTDGHLGLAQAYEKGGMAQLAAAEYVEVLKSDSNSVPALIGFGRTSQAAGLKYDRMAFLKATKLAPKSTDAWIGLGHADLIHTEFLGEGVTAFETVGRLSPNRTDYLDDYADALGRVSRGADAEAVLRRRIAAAPDDINAHYGLSQILLQNNPTPARLAEAEAEVSKALAGAPHNALAEQQMGSILLQERKTADAVKSLEQSVKDDPYNVDSLRILARAYGLVGKPELSTKLTAQADKIFDAKQQIDVQANLADQRFADPAYHRQLKALYLAAGNTFEAKREDDALAGIQKDPAGAQRSYQDLQNQIQGALK